MSFSNQADDIIRNIDSRAREVKKVSRQIRRAREVLKSQRTLKRRVSKKKVVFKKVMQGKNGGLYYINRSNKRIYLNSGQCKRCVSGRYPVRVKTQDDKQTNIALGCPPRNKVKCHRSRSELKDKIKKLQKFIDKGC